MGINAGKHYMRACACVWPHTINVFPILCISRIIEISKRESALARRRTAASRESIPEGERQLRASEQAEAKQARLEGSERQRRTGE